MSNEFKDWINDFSEEQKKNYELCMKYPILVPRNNLTVDEPSNYNYNYTMLDLIPDGWRIAFGEEWANEVQCAINKLPENKRDNIFIVQLKEKYGCYDESTEVLTKNGWKFFQYLTYKDEIATLDIDGETLIYQSPTDIISYHYSGKMYRLENRGVSLCVTPNHNLYVAKGSYYYHAKNNRKMTYPFELTSPATFFGKDKRFKKGCLWHGKMPDETFIIPGYQYTNLCRGGGVRTYRKSDVLVNIHAWLRFLGFYVAEGHSQMRNDSGTQISVAYNQTDEEELVSGLIRDIGFEASTGKNGVKNFYNVTIANWLRNNCGHLAINKKVPNFIKELPPVFIEEFLQYLYIGDGHRTKTANILTTVSKQLSDDVQELLLKCGYSFSVYQRPPKKSINKKTGQIINGKYNSYEINWLKKTEVEIDNSKHSKSFIEDWIDYDGMVYCATIPNHILYVRRNGKGVWCGNSFRQYFSNYTDDLETVIRKYENLSEKICIDCGKPATKVSTNWISPYCDECAKNIRHEIFTDIKESVSDNFRNN